MTEIKCRKCGNEKATKIYDFETTIVELGIPRRVKKTTYKCNDCSSSFQTINYLQFEINNLKNIGE